MTVTDISQLGVFQVYTGGGTGTGFLIEPTLLVTNCHVVAPYRQVAIELRDRRRVLGTVALSDLLRGPLRWLAKPFRALEALCRLTPHQHRLCAAGTADSRLRVHFTALRR